MLILEQIVFILQSLISEKVIKPYELYNYSRLSNKLYNQDHFNSIINNRETFLKLKCLNNGTANLNQ